MSAPSPISAATASSYLAAQLEGSWNVSALQLAGAQKQDRPTTATYTLSFANGRLSARADCNACAGSFTLSGTTLTAGPAIACTRAGCPTFAFEHAFTTLLGGDSEVSITNATLTLSSARGTIWFARQD